MATRLPLRALSRSILHPSPATAARAFTPAPHFNAPARTSHAPPPSAAPTETSTVHSDPTKPTPVKKAVTTSDGAVSADTSLQAPNRKGVWARSQQPRQQAMTGPRFEQTDFMLQPQPWSAMELIHKQPVRWTHERVVSCDGGGGPEGHPRIFINTDKPEISVCNYCGLPFANEHNRNHLEALPQTSYPLS